MNSEDSKNNRDSATVTELEESKVQPDSSIMEASEVDEFDNSRMERVAKLLDKLDSTQDSIVGASSFILQLCGKAPSSAPCVVSLIMQEKIPAATA